MRTLAASILLAALILLPLAAAQAPPLPGHPATGAVGFSLICDQSFFHVDFKGVAETRCRLEDLSRDSLSVPGSGSGSSPSLHMTKLTPVPTGLPDESFGWQVLLSDYNIATYGGDVRDITLRIQNLPTIKSATFPFDLVANYTGPNDEKIDQVIHMLAQVKRFDQALVSMDGATQIQNAGQEELVRFVIIVQNTGLYPDSYRFEIKPSSNVVRISPPPPLYVPPGETRRTQFNVLTPHDSLYDLGTNVQFNVRVISTTGTGAYTAFAAVNIEGPYVPIYWAPLTLVGLIAAVVVGRRTRERAELRRLESGRPRRVEVTPRQTVLLAELKRTDPAAYKERRAKLDAIYAARKEQYKGFNKERKAHDAEERRQARVEYNEAKKRQKQDRKDAAIAKKADKQAARAQRKLDKKAAKVEAKVVKKKEKLLKKARGKLEKAQAKQAKADAKQAAKDAKAQAKADKAAAKEAKAAAKAAKKAQRSGPDQEKP